MEQVPLSIKAEREAAMAEKAAAGDKEALGSLLLQYYPMMVRLAYGYAKNNKELDPLELANECFAVLMHRRLLAFDRTKASFCTWIHQHIRSVLLKSATGPASPGKRKVSKAVPFSQLSKDESISFEGLIEGREHDVCLAASIDQLCMRLDSRRAKVLKMVADGSTLESIGAELGISKQRVQHLKIDAIKELQEVYSGCESIEDMPEIPDVRQGEQMSENGKATGSNGITIATMIDSLATDEGLRQLDVEIEETKRKYDRLVALRKAMAKTTKKDVVDFGDYRHPDVEMIVKDVTENGPSTPTAIAARLGMASIGVGRAVAASPRLTKNGYGKVILAEKQG